MIDFTLFVTTCVYKRLYFEQFRKTSRFTPYLIHMSYVATQTVVRPSPRWSAEEQRRTNNEVAGLVRGVHNVEKIINTLKTNFGPRGAAIRTGITDDGKLKVIVDCSNM